MQHTSAFEEYAYSRFLSSIQSWDTQAVPDIYAMLLDYHTGWSADSKGRELVFQGQMTFSYNTLSNYEIQIERASDSLEAKWNPAFWLHDPIVAIPEHVPYGSEPNDVEFAMRDRWCAEIGVRPTGKDGTGRPEYDEHELYKALSGLCIRIVKRLHAENVFVEKFGKHLPVLVQHKEGDVEATREANPPGLSQEAEEVGMGRTYAQIAEFDLWTGQIALLSPDKQTVFWIEMILDLEFGRSSEITTKLKSLNRTKYDVQTILTAIGRPCVPVILPHIETYAVCRQLNVRNPLASVPYKAATPEANATMILLDVLRNVGQATDDEVERLYKLVQILFNESLSQEKVGPNLFSIAQTLHRLRPDRFPLVDVGGRDNKLLNFEAFGLTVSS